MVMITPISPELSVLAVATQTPLPCLLRAKAAESSWQPCPWQPGISVPPKPWPYAQPPPGLGNAKKSAEEALEDSAQGSAEDPQTAARRFQDGKTTVMLRNIPFMWRKKDVMREVMKAGFTEKFDFVYLPRGVRSHRNHGCAFINFLSSQVAQEFALAFHNRKLSLYDSTRIAEVIPATTQGYHANLSLCGRRHLIQAQQFKPVFFPREDFERAGGDCGKVGG